MLFGLNCNLIGFNWEILHNNDGPVLNFILAVCLWNSTHFMLNGSEWQQLGIGSYSNNRVLSVGSLAFQSFAGKNAKRPPQFIQDTHGKVSAKYKNKY